MSLQKLTGGVTVCVGLVLATSGLGAQPESQSRLMREKLSAAQNVLAAVVRGETNEVARLADDLLRLSQTSTWSTAQDPDYLSEAAAFQELAERLGDEARAGRDDAVAATSVELMVTCVQCHQLLERLQIAAP